MVGTSLRTRRILYVICGTLANAVHLLRCTRGVLVVFVQGHGILKKSVGYGAYRSRPHTRGGGGAGLHLVFKTHAESFFSFFPNLPAISTHGKATLSAFGAGVEASVRSECNTKFTGVNTYSRYLHAVIRSVVTYIGIGL